jgi:hypothetical protein
MRCSLAVLALLTTSAIALTVPSPVRAAPAFSPTSFWNAPLAASAPIASNSASLVAQLQRQVTSAGVWINTYQYSTPIYTVLADQPRVRVQLDGSYPPLQADLESVPLPADAVPAAGTDGHLTVYQPSTDTLWELWKASKQADGWHARWGGRMMNVSTSPGYFPAPMGATGSSLPLLGGLMRIDELEAGHIDHALALAIPSAQKDAFAWPAQRTDGSSAAPALPEGTRLRIDPSVNVAALGLPNVARQMALAAQRYGIVVRDISGAVAFFGEDPTPRGSNPYPALYGSARYPDKVLAAFPWGRLQVLAPPHVAAPPAVPAAVEPRTPDLAAIPGAPAAVPSPTLFPAPAPAPAPAAAPAPGTPSASAAAARAVPAIASAPSRRRAATRTKARGTKPHRTKAKKRCTRAQRRQHRRGCR